MRTSQSLNELLQHLEAGTLDLVNASHWLRAEVEAVTQLEGEHKTMLECLQMVMNHHDAGLSLYRVADKIVHGHHQKPVDGKEKTP